MFKFCVFLAFCIAACYAAPGGGTYCAQTPDVLLPSPCENRWAAINPGILCTSPRWACRLAIVDRSFLHYDAAPVTSNLAAKFLFRNGYTAIGRLSEPRLLFSRMHHEQIFQCLNSPHVISPEVAAKCIGAKYADECDKMTCIFRESKWLDGAAVDKTKVAAYFDQFEKDHAEWGPAIRHLKTACLGPELKAQGVYLNCPAYDVMHCVLGSFIKHATPSQWSASTSCTYPRAYAAACPVCPSDCFSLQVPIGSCNACYLPPRTA